MLFKKRSELEKRIQKLELVIPKIHRIMVIATAIIKKETELTADNMIDEILKI